ncbi:hypothetical protein [Bremerella alba]|uniref:Uncharacterized protein n=1 Tax=Bremerella alba TaxID=980252 RepID=A0A7V9A7F8_9BACT|nr:hypothetical protein [Bremerella alba]MBA2115312.1 hypothetical protein [Bremerella alba]
MGYPHIIQPKRSTPAQQTNPLGLWGSLLVHLVLLITFGLAIYFRSFG